MKLTELPTYKTYQTTTVASGMDTVAMECLVGTEHSSIIMYRCPTTCAGCKLDDCRRPESSDAWTCPVCGETAFGEGQPRNPIRCRCGAILISCTTKVYAAALPVNVGLREEDII